MREILAPIIADAIAEKVTPGAVVLVSEGGKIRIHEAFGRLMDGGLQTSTDTIYDLASITKAAATSVLLMGLVAEGRITLESKVAPMLPELIGAGKDCITVAHLLGHASGLPAHVHFFDRIWAGDWQGAASPWDALVTMAGAEPLVLASPSPRTPAPEVAASLLCLGAGQVPGSRVVYSDLGYIVLARLIENLSGARIGEAFHLRVAKPLGLEDTHFIDLAGSGPLNVDRIAPTGLGPTGKSGQRAMIRARVHDDNARSAGGMSGHAGLFSTTRELARIGQVLIDSHQGRSGFLPGEVVEQFWATAGTRSSAPPTTWRMGFDTPSSTPGVSHAGDHWPASGVGHLGFTGTSMWLAPEHNRIVVILSNRTYYSWDPPGIKALRRKLMHAIGVALTWV